MTARLDLRPSERRRIIDLVHEAGHDVRGWARYRKRRGNPAANPKYCYEWAYVQGRKAVILNLWFDELQADKRGIFRKLNLRKTATKKGKAANFATRAMRMDEAIATAHSQNLPVRVVVCAGKRSSKKASRVSRRLLDPIPWRVESYDERTGDAVIIRKSAATAKVEQKLVLQKAQSLWEELRVRLGSEVNFERHLKVEPCLAVKGWYVILGYVTKDKLPFGIAFDDYTSHPAKRFWIGFDTKSEKAGKKLKGACPARWRALKSNITESKLVPSDKGNWWLAKSLTDAELNRPIFESYRGKEGTFYFGYYTNDDDDLISKATEFVSDMVGRIAQTDRLKHRKHVDDLFDQDYDLDAKVAKKKKWVTIRKRNGVIASRLKSFYGQCQISGRDFIFQNRDGDPYTEAHHLVPLGKDGSDRLDNLIVVSAHIHRMLHHAEVSPIDLSKKKKNRLPITIGSKSFVVKWHPQHSAFIDKVLKRAALRA
jgi:hypothetical protein